jgi:hypothetical protein
LSAFCKRRHPVPRTLWRYSECIYLVRLYYRRNEYVEIAFNLPFSSPFYLGIEVTSNLASQWGFCCSSSCIYTHKTSLQSRGRLFSCSIRKSNLVKSSKKILHSSRFPCCPFFPAESSRFQVLNEISSRRKTPN